MGISDEKKLVIGCLRAAFDEAHVQYIQSLLVGNLDWLNIQSVLQYNQVSSLFYHKLLLADGESYVPENIVHDLKKNYHAVHYQNIGYINELKQLLLLFQSELVETIVLKGCALIGKLWQNAALRSMADIDILIKPHDVSRVEKLMLDSGYLVQENVFHTKEWFKQHHHHLAPFFNPRTGIIIEVHTHIASPADSAHLDMDQLWACSETASIADLETKTLCTEDTLIHLCMHFFSLSSVSGIKNLSDIAMLLHIAKDTIDWEAIEKRAVESDIVDHIYYALYAARTVLSTDVDERVLASFRSKTLKNSFTDRLLKKFIAETVVYDPKTELLPTHYYRSYFDFLFGNDPFAKRAKALVKHIFPKHPESSSEHSNHFSILLNLFSHYSLRICTLILKLAQKLFRIIGSKLTNNVSSF